MTLTEQLTDYVHACFTGIYIQTFEPDEAEREIVQHAQQQKWKVAVWDLAQGLRLPSNPGAVRSEAGPGDPLAVLRALPGLAEPNGTALLLLHNFHRYLQTAEIMQPSFAALLAGKQQRTFLVVLAPVVQVPIELEKLLVVLHHELPGRQQLERIARELTSDNPADLPQGEALQPGPRRGCRPDPLRGRGQLRAVAGPARHDPARRRHRAQGADAGQERAVLALPGRGAIVRATSGRRAHPAPDASTASSRLPGAAQGVAVRRPSQHRQDHRGEGDRRRQPHAADPGRSGQPQGQVRRRVGGAFAAPCPLRRKKKSATPTPPTRG